MSMDETLRRKQYCIDGAFASSTGVPAPSLQKVYPSTHFVVPFDYT